MLVEISEKKLDCGRNFKKYLEFGWNFGKISILVEIFENFDLVKIFEKSRFWSKFSKILIFVKIFDHQYFVGNILKMSILVEISILVEVFENFDFGQSFRKSLFW